MAKAQIFAGLMALTATLSPALVAAEGETIDTVVATVNGEELTVAHILDIRRQLPAEYNTLTDGQLYEGILGQLIQQRVLAANAVAPDWLESAMENERASLLAGAKVDELAQIDVSETDVQAAYDAQFGSFEGTPEFNASHILVATEAEAQDLVTQLEGGADFATLAMEFSTGPSGPRGGELGWFGPGMMVPAFEEAVTELEVGQVSAPVETQFGWHVVKLNDARTTQPPALEEVREDLEGAIRSEALRMAIEALEAEAEVTRAEVDPSVLSTLTLD
ncbi:MAG: peptidylprolyl isomerase [Pseudomonadota bacterium]